MINKPVSFHLTAKDYKELKKYCKAKDISVSKFIRDTIKKALK